MPTVTRADYTQSGDVLTFTVHVDLVEGQQHDPADLSERVLLAVLDTVRGN